MATVEQINTRLTGPDGTVWEYERGQLPVLTLFSDGSQESEVGREMLTEMGIPFQEVPIIPDMPYDAPLLMAHSKDQLQIDGLQDGPGVEIYKGATQISYYFLPTFVQVEQVSEAA